MKVKSKKPSKQRKAIYDAKPHQRKFTVRLDESLMEEWGIKRIPLRKDDEVRIIKGELIDVEGKVLSLNNKTGKIEIEEATLEKKNGATYYIPISPSNLVLTKFGATKLTNKKMDPWRQKIIDRKLKLQTEEAEGDTTGKKGGK